MTVFRLQLKKKDGQESFGRAPEGAEGRQRRRRRRRRPEQQEEREEGEARIFLNRFSAFPVSASSFHSWLPCRITFLAWSTFP